MFQVDIVGKKLIGLKSTNFGSMGILERYDVQEWIEGTPTILGEELLIIAKELILPSGKRLDLLAIDHNANLVVIELKRDNSGSDIDMQAIKYASYISNFTVDDIFEVFAKHLKSTESEAQDKIEQFIETDIELLNDIQRIILVAGEFHPEVASAVLWLRDNYQVDIKCVRLRVFTDSKTDLYITPDVIIPLPEAKNYIERRETKQRVSKQSQNTSFSMEIGEYDEEELRNRLEKTLTKYSPLTPRFLAFLEIILSDEKAFKRDEIISSLFNRGIGENIGQTGRYMSNISQLLTARSNDHLRQVISFVSDGGAGSQKDDFRVISEYRQLLSEIILTVIENQENDS